MASSIDSLLQKAVESGKFLGVAYMAVKKNGSIMYSNACGHESFNRDSSMTIHTGAWLASCSKLMTSTAAMIAVEKGMIKLDDDVAGILPELRGRQILVSFDAAKAKATYVPPSEKITLRYLLSHAAGFAYPPFHPELAKWAAANRMDFSRFLGDFRRDWDSPQVYQPGTDWCYGTAIDWAGKVIEKVSHMSLEDFMQEYIWSKLGMNNTTFHPRRHEQYAILQMATRSNSGGLLVPCDCPYPLSAQNESGGGGLFSTCEDYSKLLGALLRDECPLLEQESIDAMLSPQLTPQSKAGLQRRREEGWVLPEIPPHIRTDHTLAGLYLEDPVPGGRSVGSVTWDGMCSTQWLLDRSAGIGSVLIVQMMVADAETKLLWMELEQETYTLAHSLNQKD